MNFFRATVIHFGLVAAVFSPDPGHAAEPVVQLPSIEVRDFRPLRREQSFDLPEPRYGAAVVTAGDYLYVIGGSNDSGTRLDSIERMDLRTAQTVPWARLKLARRHHRAVVLGDSIYVLGGTSMFGPGGSGLTDELPEYDNEDDSIYAAAKAFTASNADQYRAESDRKPNDGDGSAARSEPPLLSYETSMEIVDLATGQSRFGPPMPVGKALFGCVALEGKIYVIGGQRKRGDSVYTTNTTEVFDPVKGQWGAGVNMPTPRRCTAVVVDNFAMVLGGSRGAQRVATVEVFNPREKVWRRLPDLAERCNPSAVVRAGSRLFLFGGQATSRRQLTYDLHSKKLQPYPMPFPDGDFAAAVAHEGRIFVVGGAGLYTETVNAAIQVFSVAAEPAAAGPVER